MRHSTVQLSLTPQKSTLKKKKAAVLPWRLSGEELSANAKDAGLIPVLQDRTVAEQLSPSPPLLQPLLTAAREKPECSKTTQHSQK